MMNNIAGEIVQRLIHDFEFKENGKYLQNGKCPQCGKREMFTSIEKPFIVKCGRENKCGTEIITKEHYADLFCQWSDRYISTPEKPHAAADAYLSVARGIDISRFGGCYTQENFVKGGEASATVRFALAGGTFWERLIDRPERFDRKANFRGSYGGQWWQPPGTDLAKAKQLWIVEGCIDALSLAQNGITAVSIMSSNNYPDKALAALLAIINGGYKPALVWALDSDKAGQKAIKKFAKRSRDEGWIARAAQIQEGKQKRDWNDLHLLGKLEKHHTNKYRHLGDLLLAESAAEKAHLMFDYSGINEFHLDFDGRLYWFKLDIEKNAKAIERIQNEDNRLSRNETKARALKESGGIKEIANCMPEPLYFQRSEPTDEAWYYFRVSFPGATPPVKGTFTSSQIASAAEFKKRLLHVAKGAIYTGNTNQLDRIIQRDLPAIKEVQTQKFIGYNKDWGAWVFNSLAVSGGRVIPLNGEDYFEIDKLSVKSLSSTPVLEINPDLTSFRTEWLDDLWIAFGVKGYVALAFWFGSLFAEQLREKHKSFPFLEISGEPGTGKSTLIDFLWRLCGRDEYEGFDPSKSTKAGGTRNFAQVGNLPVVLIEGDRTQDNARQRGFDFDDLKALYNGRSVRTTGVKSSGNETYEPPFRGAIVIAQNAEVEASKALQERIVHLQTDKSGQTQQTREAAERLERVAVEQVSGFILLSAMAESSVMASIDKHYEAAKVAMEENEEIAHNRIAKNHAQLIALVKSLPCIVDIPEERIASTCEAITGLAVERRKAISADHPLVVEFWNIFDFLDGDSPFGVNHSGKGNDKDFSVNFSQMSQEASALRVDIPFELRDVKPLLKTSRSRVYVREGAVRSEISKQKNTGKGSSAPKVSEVVKCLIFRAKDAGSDC
ncbi:toprim domain-containing protein [Enterobacter sp. PTB]|uniref:toprim domain-containing protein n=1 Tax=Enterobacter sp. PTB TaxID=3143437 RepID=UPI003DA8CD6B